jgi:hypothetical protein
MLFTWEDGYYDFQKVGLVEVNSISSTMGAKNGIIVKKIWV